MFIVPQSCIEKNQNNEVMIYSKEKKLFAHVLSILSSLQVMYSLVSSLPFTPKGPREDYVHLQHQSSQSSPLCTTTLYLQYEQLSLKQHHFKSIAFQNANITTRLIDCVSERFHEKQRPLKAIKMPAWIDLSGFKFFKHYYFFSRRGLQYIFS